MKSLDIFIQLIRMKSDNVSDRETISRSTKPLLIEKILKAAMIVRLPAH